jgi:hypothetical protein
MTADEVLAVVAAHPHVMGTLDSGTCAIQHVSRRRKDGPDERLDGCPCGREFADGELDALDEPTRKLLDLGGGQYVSSPLHTLGDLVRDVVEEV